MEFGPQSRVDDGECFSELDELWFTMHHSEDQNRKLSVLGCYVDDSGTEEQSRLVVLGSLLLDRTGFFRFDDAWKKMLRRYGLNALHMTDFVRPYGKHVGMFPEMKLSLFKDAVKIIEARREMSISVALRHSGYREQVPIDVYRTALAPYTVAFISLSHLNAKIADAQDYPDRIAYIVDRGSPYSDQINMGHLYVAASEKQAKGTHRTGSLTFENDVLASPLQAADAIAWSARRRFSGDGLTEEYAPLEEIFRERFDIHGNRVRPHLHHWVEDDVGEKIITLMRDKGPELLNEALRARDNLLGI